MKKIFAILFVAAGCLSPAMSQTGNEYKDLLTLFVSEKFEKCISKAEGYMNNDKTKKDALPYLFISRCYFEMSKRDEFKAEYPGAFKDAMKYIVKYAGKDKERTHFSEYEEFISELRKAAILEAETMFEMEKYTKSKSLYDQLVKLDPNDAGARLMLAQNLTLMKAKKESALAFDAAYATIESKSVSTAKEQLSLLKSALITVATSLHETGNRDKAKELMEFGQEYFKDDKEFKLTYETIVG